MMIEGSGAGSGSGSIPLTSGSGSGRPKNMWIRIRIRIRNTGQDICVFFTLIIFIRILYCEQADQLHYGGQHDPLQPGRSHRHVRTQDLHPGILRAVLYIGGTTYERQSKNQRLFGFALVSVWIRILIRFWIRASPSNWK
jgi:hypothetical protein